MNTWSLFFAWVCLAAWLVMAAPAPAQTPAVPGTPAAKPAAIASPKSGQVLTDDQIAALLTEWTNEKNQGKLFFSSSFGPASVSPSARQKYAKSGKIPLTIVCQIVEVKEVRGKKVSMRLGGRAHLYILDPDGKVFENKSVSLDKMCPS